MYPAVETKAWDWFVCFLLLSALLLQHYFHLWRLQVFPLIYSYPDWQIQRSSTHIALSLFWWRHPQTVLHFKASLGFHDTFSISEVRSCNKDELFSCPKYFVVNPGTGKIFISSWTFISYPYHVYSSIELNSTFSGFHCCLAFQISCIISNVIKD